MLPHFFYEDAAAGVAADAAAYGATDAARGKNFIT